VRGPSFSRVRPSAGFTFDLLGGESGLSRLLLFLCGLRLLLSGLFVLRWRGVGIVVGGENHGHRWIE